MNGHLSDQLIEGYRRRTLSPVDLLDADDHLAGCESCRRRLSEASWIEETSRSLRAGLETEEPTHLAYERLEAYIDGALNPVEREIVESHATICAGCASELEDLRAFAGDLAAPSAAVSRTAPAVHPRSSKGKPWREWFEEFRAWPTVWVPLQVAGVGLIVGLLVWSSWLRTRNFELQAALDEQRRANEKLNQEYQAKNGTVAELEKRIAALESPSSTFPMTLKDGGAQVALDSMGNLTGVAQAYQEVVKQTLTSGRVETPSMLASLAGKSAELMGAASEGRPFALLTPVGVVVMTDRPEFRWHPLEGAGVYIVRIYDADFNELAASPKLSATTWTASTPLKRGRVYTWQVTALIEDREVVSPVKPAPDAKFLVLDQAKADEIARAKSEDAGAHLTLGVVYARAGLVEDAEREFRALSRANPRSEIAKKLLQDLKSKKR